MSNVKRSPFFYVGDKYKLMPQLSELFPKNISSYIEPFLGGGSSFLNTIADKYFLNDKNQYVITLHKMLCRYSDDEELLFKELYELIHKFGLTCSAIGISCPNEIKELYKKTYYSVVNKVAYNRLKEAFNNDFDSKKLYLLLIYGFNHMIRFNRSGIFNLPVGNVDFNKNVVQALKDYLNYVKNLKIQFSNFDYKEFIQSMSFEKNSFVYFDPPYLISGSEYNKDWTDVDEISLYKIIDELASKGVRFGVTNLVSHKGKKNEIFSKWLLKYEHFDIRSNYISFNDNSIKSNTHEVYVTNVRKTN